MNDLNRKAFAGLVFFLAALAAILFVTAWTFDYWEAWLYLGVFSVCVILITLYLSRYDTDLLARRIAAGSGAEKERIQKIIQFIAQFAFMAEFIVPALDHRFGWSSISVAYVVAADVIVAIGFFIVFLVFRENTFTSATIEVASEQKVISTGPYRLVRHPMYSGALLMLCATSIALGSWWGLLAFLPMLGVIVWRLHEEEKYLVLHLPGYQAYREKVRSRLIPYVY